MQSVSFMHGPLVLKVEPMLLPVALLTLPPPFKLLMRAIESASCSANQRFLSGPVVMPAAFVFGVGMGYSEMPPMGVERPMALVRPGSVNHILLSGPAVMA